MSNSKVLALVTLARGYSRGYSRTRRGRTKAIGATRSSRSSSSITSSNSSRRGRKGKGKGKAKA